MRSPEALLPFGMYLDLTFPNIEIMPAGNRYDVVKFGKRRGVRREPRAEAFIQTIRAGCFACFQEMKKHPELGKLEIPIPGKECPIRVDVLFQFSAAQSRTMILSDLENLTKGVFDGLKYGRLEGAAQDFGLIDDDRYITATHIEKGEAAEGEGSSIWLRISRAGFRNAFDMDVLKASVLFPIPPFDAANKGLSAKDRHILEAPRKPIELFGPGGNLLRTPKSH